MLWYLHGWVFFYADYHLLMPWRIDWYILYVERTLEQWKSYTKLEFRNFVLDNRTNVRTWYRIWSQSFARPWKRGYQASSYKMGRTQKTERRQGVNKCSNKDFISVTLLITLWPITKVVRDLFKPFHWDHMFGYRMIVRAPTKNSLLPFPEWWTAKSSQWSPLFQPANFADSRRLVTTLIMLSASSCDVAMFCLR